MRQIPVKPTSRISMQDLAIHQEGDDWIAGRADSGDFIEIPYLGVRAIRLLADGHTPGEVQERLESDPDETVDVVEFAGQLRDLGFLQSIDGLPLDDQEKLAPNLPWLRQEHMRWLCAWPALVVYAAVTATAITLVCVHPRLLPSYRDLLISRSASTIVVADMALALAIAGLHELAHLAAARSVGVPARINWGTRLFDLVAQTSMPGVWAVPLRDRLRCYLAGVGCDIVLASALITAQACGIVPGPAGPVVRAAVALAVIGVFLQLQVFKRTDVYFVIADLIRARNLHDQACLYLIVQLRALAGRLRGRHAGTGCGGVMPPAGSREYQLVRNYAWFMLAGGAASATALVVLIVPTAVVVISRSCSELATGISRSNYLQTADASGAIAILCGFWILFLVVFARSRGPWLRRVLATAPAGELPGLAQFEERVVDVPGIR
jgi:putative peptide zinc metalloprotease protein